MVLLTAEKVRDGVMTLKTITTRNLVLYCQGNINRDLRDLIAMELEARHCPQTGLGYSKLPSLSDT